MNYYFFNVMETTHNIVIVIINKIEFFYSLKMASTKYTNQKEYTIARINELATVNGLVYIPGNDVVKFTKNHKLCLHVRNILILCAKLHVCIFHMVNDVLIVLMNSVNMTLTHIFKNIFSYYEIVDII